MNLRSRCENACAAGKPAPRQSGFAEVIFGQNRRACLEWGKLFMSLLFSRQIAFCSVKHYKKSRIPTDRQILPARNRFTS
jgi:hypothetical protein